MNQAPVVRMIGGANDKDIVFNSLPVEICSIKIGFSDITGPNWCLKNMCENWSGCGKCQLVER